MTEGVLRHKSDSTLTSLPGLPLVLQESLPRRLRVAALTYAGVFIVMLMVHFVELWLDDSVALRSAEHYITMSSCALGAILVALWARSRVSSPALHFGGLVFQIIGTFGIAVASIDLPLPEPQTPGYIGIPWTCPWILAYPLMVPSIPRHALVAGVLSSFACAAGVAFRLAVLEPAAPAPLPQIWVAMIFMNLVCAVWGIVGSVTVNKLGRQVAEARRLGSYHLDELLGKGGMGEVWKARHRLLARQAAVKIIRTEFLGGSSDSQMVTQRFEREAQATAALQSPHSISLYDYGVADDGTFFYVMELLDGMDLGSLVNQFGPVESERAIHWLRHACHSLAEAHHNGLIHRDIKPANLYACHFGLEWDFLKVLDFGLVKPTGTTEEGAAALTAEHTITGTAAYLPPEIASGAPEIDGRADIYALGCVAYYLVTGKLVFDSETAMKMIIDHIQTEPSPPSMRTEIEVDPDLEQIILACLQKKPADRPQSALELADRLSHCRRATDWTPSRAQNWWNLHRPTSPSAR